MSFFSKVDSIIMPLKLLNPQYATKISFNALKEQNVAIEIIVESTGLSYEAIQGLKLVVVRFRGRGRRCSLGDGLYRKLHSNAKYFIGIKL